MANNIKRIIKEEGVVLEKIFKGATEAFVSLDGRQVAPQPDRYILRCVSGEEFSTESGFIQSTVLDYKTEKSVFDKVKCYSPVVVKYEMSNFGAKPQSVELKESK